MNDWSQLVKFEKYSDRKSVRIVESGYFSKRTQWEQGEFKFIVFRHRGE